MSSKARPTSGQPQPAAIVQASSLAENSPSTSRDVSERALKKRESDRRCQRVKRERTKSKIAALEEQVRELGSADPTGQVRLLMKQLQEVETQRDALVKKVKVIESVIHEDDSEEAQPLKAGSAYDNSALSDLDSQVVGGGEATADRILIDSHIAGKTASCRAYGSSSTNLSSGSVSSHDTAAIPDDPLSFRDTATVIADHTTGAGVPDVATSTGFQPPRVPFRQELGCECSATKNVAVGRPQFNTWRFTNETLGSRFSWPAHFRLLRDTYRDDTPIRAVIEGWESIETRGPMHPTWQILKKMDQALCTQCGPKERLAFMYVTQLLLISHATAKPHPELPDFYQKRPSQNLADSYAIHFFPWPSMRERFVFSQHRYCSNNFWNMFVHSLQIMWPYEFRDCYTRNVETGLYAISPLFQERVNDIKCWTVGPDFLQRWPELRSDIPAASSIPRPLSNTVSRFRRSLNIPQQTNRFDVGLVPSAAVFPVQSNTPFRAHEQDDIASTSSLPSQFLPDLPYTVNSRNLASAIWTAQDMSYGIQEYDPGF